MSRLAVWRKVRTMSNDEWKCRQCGCSLGVDARWCDPCADEREPGPMPDLNQNDPWLMDLEAELNRDFPEARARWDAAIKRINRKARR